MGEEKRIKDLATASSITNSDYLAIDNGNNSASKKTSAMPLKNVQGSSDVYSSLKAYKVGDLVIQNNQLYQCNTDCAAASWSTNSGYFDAVTLASAVSELNEALSKMVELLPYVYNRSLNVGASINLSDSFLNYKYITFVYGSINNCIAIDVPSIIFKKICDSQPEKFIIWQWNNIWFRIEYLTQTTLKYRGSTSGTDILYLPAIYGHN